MDTPFVGSSRPPAAIRAPVIAVVFTALAACGIPGVPSLPAPGAEPVAAPWPGADAAARAAAAAPLSGEDAAIEGGCLRRHLEEAIELNERRLPVYSGWTGGASEAVSRELIAGERRGLLAARYVDRLARRYHRVGIPIVCAEFVSMSTTPPLDSSPSAPPSLPFPPGPDPNALEARVRAGYGAGGFAAVVDIAVAELSALPEPPVYHCMVRHLLESIARTAALAPLHAEAAGVAGLPSTVPLSELMIRLHLAILRDSAALDRAAAPFQASGVPIICGDVPPIPHPPVRPDPPAPVPSR